MATIDRNTRTLFFTTSPRSPQRMRPEIGLLAEEFAGFEWNSATQVQFMRMLTEQDFYNGNPNPKDPAFSARDRITRAPKALGFVDLKPVIEPTPAGEAYVFGKFPQEALLRQLLKFQLPSPFHKLAPQSTQDFCVKPYLEILRLVRHFGTLAFDELMLFGMQLTDYRKFDSVVAKIEEFRKAKTSNRGSYRTFFGECCEREIGEIYRDAIASGATHTRETRDSSLDKFVRTKRKNMRDYADACFRYLRATEIVTISQVGHSLSIPRDTVDDVDFILNHVDREPCFVDDVDRYKEYLFDATVPELLSDDLGALRAKIRALDPSLDTSGMSLSQLKDKELALREAKRESILAQQIHAIKDYQLYNDIQSTYDGIVQGEYYDNPLMLEWNTWRAMTMLDGGSVNGNFGVDDEGQPLSTAAGNQADVECNYGSFSVAVEVTLQSGQRQFDTETEPVSRHLGRLKEKDGHTAYCLFIAPAINESTIAYFYGLQQIDIPFYGGKPVIVPIELGLFRKMLEASYEAGYAPEPHHIEALFLESVRLAKSAHDHIDWYEAIRRFALSWPNGA